MTCLFLVLSVVAFSQEKMLTGLITDSSGEGIPGVNVTVKGTFNGTVTDMDGNYKLGVANKDAVIVFSFIGFKTVEQQQQGRTVINLVMEEDAIGLNEVVAVGYGVQRKSDLTGSISSVSSAQMKDIPLSRVDQALQGINLRM